MASLRRTSFGASMSRSARPSVTFVPSRMSLESRGRRILRMHPTLASMTQAPAIYRVEVTFVFAAPTRQVERALGVRDFEPDAPILRCLVMGGFQPFLEALRALARC